MGNQRQQAVKRHDVALLLYMLRRKWGTPADFYKVSAGIPDFVSGDRSVTRVKHAISQFVTSTVTTTRKFEYDIGYLAANKNFTYGGFYEPGDRVGFIAGEDVPGLDDVTQEDYLIINGQRYNMERIIALDYKQGWYLHLKRIIGQKRYAIIDTVVYQRLELSEEQGGSL